MLENRLATADKPLHRALLAGAVVLFLSLSIQEIKSPDFWWQLRTGEWVVDHRAVPRHDELSYSVPDNEWIESRWLFFVLTSLGWSLGGSGLLILAQTLVLGLAGLVLVAPSRRVLWTMPGALVLILGILTASSRFIVRPEIVTFLMVSIYLVTLDDYRRGGSRRLVWALPFAQIFWTNSHTLFILGPLLAWLFVAGEIVSRMLRGSSRQDPPPRTSVLRGLAVQAVLLTLVCFVNPYGHRGAMLPLLLFHEMHGGSILGRGIEELRSPFALARWSWDLWAGAALAALSGATFVLNRRKTDPTRLMIWTAIAYLAGQSMRNVALFGFVGTWAALLNLDELRAGRRRAEAGPSWLPRSAPPVLRVMLLLLILAASWYVATDRYYVRMGRDQRFGLGVVPSSVPAAATDFILGAAASPQLFHAMEDGPYLTWAARGRFPVFIDGRHEVYGEPFIREYLAVAAGRRDWESFANRWQIDTVMLHRRLLAPLIVKIRQSPRWVLVHIDDRELVFVRDIAEHKELIGRYRIDPTAPWTPRAPEPVEALSGFRLRIGSAGRPWHSLGMARTFLLLGSVDNAAAYLERGLARFPRDWEVRAMLAQVYRSRHRNAEADRLLSGLRLPAEEAARMEQLLAYLRELESMR